MKVAVVSARYGSYDRPVAQQAQDTEADWIMVTDDPDVAEPPWRVIVEPRQFVEPRLASRVPKTHPEFYTDADVIIWIDSNVQIISDHFVRWAVESLGDNDLCQFQQAFRRDIHDEIEASKELPKWDGEPFDRQLDYYLSKGYPADYGIWWCGLMIRSGNCPRFGSDWLTEIVRWTCQDQMAHSYLMHAYGIRPVEPIAVGPQHDTEHHKITTHQGHLYTLNGRKLRAPAKEMESVWGSYEENLRKIAELNG